MNRKSFVAIIVCMTSIFAQAVELPAVDSVNTARLEQVAKRRAGTAIICHRGSWEFAHENTLEAYRATFELGADGNEIDIRATSDGVLICFHDDSLEMLLEAFGDASDHDWANLQTFAFRNPGRYGLDCRIPTLEEAILLHKKYGGLMQLDVKRPKLEPAIIALLDKHDAWDHVVAANGVNAPALLKHPKFRGLGYKASLIEERKDVDPAVIKASLTKPGAMIMVDDPRAVLHALGRKPGKLSTTPYAPKPHVAPAPPYYGDIAESHQAKLLALPNDVTFPNDDSARTAEDWQLEAGLIAQRAEVAEAIRITKRDTPTLRKALKYRVAHRRPHPDWGSHGLDSGSALRALGEFRDPEFVNTARHILWLDDPANEKVQNPEFKVPRSWTDFRMKFIAVALLDRFPGSETEQLCRDYLRLGNEEARKIGPLQFEGIARVLLTISPSEETAVELLRHRRGEVRGRAVLICLAKWDEPWAKHAIKTAAPFALDYAPNRE